MPDDANAAPLARTQVEWLADGASCLEAALAYLAVGWCPVPLCPPDHIGVGKKHGRECEHPGKAPLIAGWTSFTALPTVDQVRGWWKEKPNANVGVVMGQISGLVGLDIDGVGGEAAWAKAARSAQLPPPTASFRTPGGGRRLLFSVAAEQVVAIAAAWSGERQEIRVLGDGSQTVVPPSRHFLGGYYAWTLFTLPKATTPTTTR
jgi:hypothetical protein